MAQCLSLCVLHKWQTEKICNLKRKVGLLGFHRYSVTFGFSYKLWNIFTEIHPEMHGEKNAVKMTRSQEPAMLQQQLVKTGVF